jgi:hypothetical protein
MWREFDGEMYLVSRLKVHDPSSMKVFAGITDAALKKQRMREVIQKVGPSVIVGRDKDRRPISYGAAFEALYGEPL